jgi:hypothetical protein
MKTLVILSLLASSYGPRPESIIKTSHLSSTEIAVSCKNGADPTGQKIGDVLLISCGK